MKDFIARCQKYDAECKPNIFSFIDALDHVRDQKFMPETIERVRAITIEAQRDYAVRTRETRRCLLTLLDLEQGAYENA